MEPTCFLLLLFGGTAHALLPSGESVCNGTQEKSRFSVTLGATVSIQVMANASGHRVQCKKVHPGEPVLVFTVKREKVLMEEPYGNRANFFISNGTLTFSSVEKTDSGQYILEIFNSIGCSVKNLAVELDVQESRFSILIPVCSALAALLVIVVLSLCLCRKRRRSGRSGSAKSRNKKTAVEFWQTSDDRTQDTLLSGWLIRDMRATAGLVLLLVTVGQGASKLCDGRNDGARCYARLSGEINIHLVDTPPYLYYWKKGRETIFYGRGRLFQESISGRTRLDSDSGVMTMVNVTKTDGGNYTLEFREGQYTLYHTLQLLVEGAGKPCDATKEEARCYGRLGGEIEIQLVNSGQNSFNWKRDKNIYIVYRNGVIINTSVPRVSFSPNNGTAKIVQLKKTDAGNYSLISYDSDTGQRISNRTMQLLIEAPITAVDLEAKCEDGGRQSVFCTSDGDDLQYGWRLNGRAVEQAQLLHGHVDQSNITLKPNVSGLLVCSVNNQVTQVRREVDVSCGENPPGDALVGRSTSACSFSFFLVLFNCSSNGTFRYGWMSKADRALCDNPDGENEDRRSVPYLPILGGVLSALVMLLVIALAVTYLRKKKAGGGDDERELTYAEVRMVRQPRASIRVNQDLEVTYGQVKIPQRGRAEVK
ncbi:uncharacterized protein LOC144082669 [Stigmatopora argus]